jgi:hypothetical protein
MSEHQDRGVSMVPGIEDSRVKMMSELEFLKSLWGLGTEEE